MSHLDTWDVSFGGFCPKSREVLPQLWEGLFYSFLVGVPKFWEVSVPILGGFCPYIGKFFLKPQGVVTNTFGDNFRNHKGWFPY